MRLVTLDPKKNFCRDESGGSHTYLRLLLPVEEPVQEVVDLLQDVPGHGVFLSGDRKLIKRQPNHYLRLFCGPSDGEDFNPVSTTFLAVARSNRILTHKIWTSSTTMMHGVRELEL